MLTKTLLLWGAALSAWGAQSPTFEVASVKTAAPSERPIYLMKGGPGTPDPGQLTCSDVPLQVLIMRAYNVKIYQLSSARSLQNDHYDIVAKVPPGATEQQFRLMLQNLLAERIGLKVRHEARDLLVYEMVVAKGGIKMKPAEAGTPVALPADDGGRRGGAPMTTDKDGKPQIAAGRATRAIIPLSANLVRISARMQGAEEIRGMMENRSGHPVTDKSGLTGKYDFNLDFAWDAVAYGAPDNAAPAEPAPDFLTAIQDQLGLKLEPKKGPVDMLIVESWNKVPTEN